VSDNNAKINKGLNEGNKIITEMSRKEFLYKIGLYFVIFALFVTIVAVLINKIVHLFS
jgi:t-SNARE complex subunit (syntaxin)